VIPKAGRRETGKGKGTLRGPAWTEGRRELDLSTRLTPKKKETLPTFDSEERGGQSLDTR